MKQDGSIVASEAYRLQQWLIMAYPMLIWEYATCVQTFNQNDVLKVRNQKFGD
jgi:hypothetical protein